MLLKKVKDSLTPKLRKIQSDLDKLPAQAHNFFVKVTPKDTGNARRKTKLTRNRIIQADYPYAKPLDDGWSRQAPNGMTKPTRDFIKNQLRKILGR